MWLQNPRDTAAQPKPLRFFGEKNLSKKHDLFSRLQETMGVLQWKPGSFLAPGAYCLLLLSDSGPGVRTSPREVVPSKRCEAMAAWWDMLFLTMSPFRHNTTSCRAKPLSHPGIYCWTSTTQSVGFVLDWGEIQSKSLLSSDFLRPFADQAMKILACYSSCPRKTPVAVKPTCRISPKHLTMTFRVQEAQLGGYCRDNGGNQVP
ncbi:hypothetical protein U0070_012405, partial [Myodes glareolus]